MYVSRYVGATICVHECMCVCVLIQKAFFDKLILTASVGIDEVNRLYFWLCFSNCLRHRNQSNLDLFFSFSYYDATNQLFVTH